MKKKKKKSIDWQELQETATQARTVAEIEIVAKEVIRWCKDIGQFAIDRPPQSCLWRTSFCSMFCFNGKLYKAFSQTMVPKDLKNAIFWEICRNNINNASIAIHKVLDRKRNQTKRVRLMTRGEAIGDRTDLKLIDRLIKDGIRNKYTNKKRFFWIPTRAWRDPALLKLLKARINRPGYGSLLASLDPSNSKKEIDKLKRAGFSTMFFGNDSQKAVQGRFKCPKTWKHDKYVGEKGPCGTCQGGCFADIRKDVHLKQH